MRNELRIAIAIFLIGQRMAIGADCGCCAPENPVDSCECAARDVGGWYGSGEYLLWWFKSASVPPLVTAGGDAKLGSPGTQVLLDNLNFADGVRQGGRFIIGYRSETDPAIGVEARYFFTDNDTDRIQFASDGPVLGRPYFDILNGVQNSTLVAQPGVASGSITVGAQTQLQGADVNLIDGLLRSGDFHLSLIGGFRFLRLDDSLRVDEAFLFAGNHVDLFDQFNNVNNFYGGQLGFDAGWQFKRLSINFRSLFALGLMRESVFINGQTHFVAPSGDETTFQGGLLALRTNIGRYAQNEFAFVPEIDLNIGYQLTPRIKLFAGYSLLWLSTVVRAGEELDTTVNTSVFPILSGDGPLVGPARPVFRFVESDFWAQGLNFGVEVSF
jgi:hypothetical protein